MCMEKVRKEVNGEWLQRSVKHGEGCVIVWGSMSAIGVGDLVKTEYHQIQIHYTGTVSLLSMER